MTSQDDPKVQTTDRVAEEEFSSNPKVLAEMDESELQRLPADMQDEARRARASLEPDSVLLRADDDGENETARQKMMGRSRASLRARNTVH
ncbi:hypothetical protein ANCCEY_13164 [Ancylostoma ceylanicum]|uniref:Uncharacterized protein n=1 Tax=Ancylostoma ceylanicum TaxID=53326 RepID=A0A0D6LD17_9BILA|nr:hypothetical protein ANCCEY_13164 [Ancylostoma ceylanicum]